MWRITKTEHVKEKSEKSGNQMKPKARKARNTHNLEIMENKKLKSYSKADDITTKKFNVKTTEIR